MPNTPLPRPEYPRPQFQRADWLNLNGVWQFEIDAGDSGKERGLLEAGTLQNEIVVPFCPEAKLSGIEQVDWMNAVWYRREVEIPAAWRGRQVLLHFQAVDYETTVWVNGVEVYRHRGGFTPFTCRLEGVAEPGEKATITVRARDRKDEPKPAGKQAIRYGNHGCFYTRTTGIWQTVWMEPVPQVHLRRPRITPSVARRRFFIEQPLSANAPGHRVRATLFWKGAELDRDEVPADADLAAQLELTVPETELHLWGPGAGNLYDVRLEVLDASGAIVDRAESYAGLRAITIEGKSVRINGQPFFQRQVLDQGWYPDGLMTAPSDEALARDIELAMEAGFNSARLAQKVFEERFHYHADRLGYPTWAEFADWGLWGVEAHISPKDHDPYASCIAQWLEALERDYSHPSIIGWCGLCESPQPAGRHDSMTARDDLLAGCFHAAKNFDKTRPVLSTSGFVHRLAETDVLDCHQYEQDPAELDRIIRAAEHDPSVLYHSALAWPWVWRGQPFFVSEFGGIKWNPAFAEDDDGQEVSWGYGEAPRSLEAFHARFEGLCRVLLENPQLFGFCYTQLTDTFQEQNGIYYFDRTPKFDLARIRAALQRSAAVESATA